MMREPTRRKGHKIFVFLLVAAGLVALAQLYVAQQGSHGDGASLGVPLLSASRLRETFTSPPPPPHLSNTGTEDTALDTDVVQRRIPTPQNPKGGGFIHMGKTGGSTLSSFLRNGCHSFMPHPCRNITAQKETPASRLIESYYHVPDFGLLQQSEHDFLLITARDPFDRTVSAFCYEHILNRDARNETLLLPNMRRLKFEMAYECFPTLETFVGYLDGFHSTEFNYPYHKAVVHPQPCVDFARAALHGRVKVYSHFYFGFERIRSFLMASRERQQQQQESPTIYVARQEQLWEDWVEINKLLAKTEQESDTTTSVMGEQGWQQQQQQSFTTSRRNTTALELAGNVKLPVSRHLSPTGQQSLCQALQSEYQAYFWFLRQAANLQQNRGAWEFSLRRAKERCGEYLDVDELAAESTSDTW